MGLFPLDATLLVFPAIVKTPSESWTLIGSEDKRTYLALWGTHALRRMRLVKRESNQFIDKRLRVCVLCFGILTILPQYFLLLLLLASERSLMTGVICDIIESLGFLEEETKEILSRLPQGAPYPTAKPEKQAALSRCTPISLLISKFSTVDVSLG